MYESNIRIVNNIFILSTNTTISEKVKNKIDQVVKDPKERKFLYELIERELTYAVTEEPLKVKKEFKLILDQHFPFKDGGD